MTVRASTPNFVHFTNGPEPSRLTPDIVRQLLTSTSKMRAAGGAALAEEWIANMPATSGGSPGIETKAEDKTTKEKKGYGKAKSSMDLSASAGPSSGAPSSGAPVSTTFCVGIQGQDDSSSDTVVMGEWDKKKKNRVRQQMNKDKKKSDKRK